MHTCGFKMIEFSTHREIHMYGISEKSEDVGNSNALKEECDLILRKIRKNNISKLCLEGHVLSTG